MKVSTAKKAKHVIAMILTLAMMLSMLPMQVLAAADTAEREESEAYPEEAAQASAGHTLYRLPDGEVVATTEIDYGTGYTEAFIVHEAGSIGTGGWVQGPLSFVPYNDTPHPDGDHLDYVYAISFTIHFPAEVFGIHHSANPPMVRFDTRVLPTSAASAMMVNSAEFFQTPYDYNIVPSVFDDVLPAGYYDGTVSRINTGFWYRTHMDTGVRSFIPSQQLTIGGVDYVSFHYTVHLSEFISEVVDEIHFTVSMGNLRVVDNVYITGLTAHFGDTKHGGADATAPPSRIFMDGHTSSHSINDFHFMQRHGAPIVTDRGIWGGTQSRITVTSEGTFATYTHRHDDEDLVGAGGHYGVDGRPMHGRVAFLFRPAGTDTWHMLYEWPDSVGSPALASDAAGNVYVVSHMTRDGSHEPGSSASRATFRPWVAMYTAGSWNGDAATTPIRHFVWEEMDNTISNSYTAVGFSPDGRIVLGTSGNGISQNSPINCGAIDLLVFCTNALEWVDAARLWTGQRFAYKYINFDEDGNIQIVGHRNGYFMEAGFTQQVGGSLWIFDGFHYWRVNRNFFDELQNSYPREYINGPQIIPEHPPLLRYAQIIYGVPVSLTDMENYQYPSRWPHISNTHHGDTFWDDNGDIHMLYAKTYHGNNFRPEMWHTVIRDGAILFTGPIMATPRNAHTIFFKDSAGSYFLLAMFGGTPLTRSQGVLYTAADTRDTGWTWERVGVFTLPAPIASAGIAQDFNVGMSGQGDSIHVMYAVRYPATAAGSNANYWAYFRLDLATGQAVTPTVEVPDVPGDGLIRFAINNAAYRVDGVNRVSDVPPFMSYDTAMVPLRVVATALGIDVEWISATQTVVMNNGQLTLTVGEQLPDGIGAAMLIRNRVFVPLCYVYEILGADVRWDEIAQVAYVYM